MHNGFKLSRPFHPKILRQPSKETGINAAIDEARRVLENSAQDPADRARLIAVSSVHAGTG